MMEYQFSIRLFLTSVFWLAWLSDGMAQQQDGDYFVYVSSASDDNGAGILLLDFNSATGHLEVLREFKHFTTTSYLNTTRDGRFLYAVRRGDKGSGFLSGFAINRQSGDMTFINEVGDFGRGPCYVAASNDAKEVLVANYAEGNICSFRINRRGKVKKLRSNLQHKGASKATDRQQGPHPHMILPAPENDIVMVPDLGLDQLRVYRLGRDGKLYPSGKGWADVPRGGGPRHFAFHPNGRYGYVINELSGAVTVFDYDGRSGNLAAKQTISTLPESFTDYNKSADIHLTPDGKFLYASNRGPNSIALFEVNPDNGKLVAKGTFPSGGEWPRAFEVDPTGNFLLVANKNTNDISVFRIDPATGQTAFLHRLPGLGAPQCIKFLVKQE